MFLAINRSPINPINPFELDPKTVETAHTEGGIVGDTQAFLSFVFCKTGRYLEDFVVQIGILAFGNCQKGLKGFCRFSFGKEILERLFHRLVPFKL